jgi:type IV secretory pathway VirJ component
MRRIVCLLTALSLGGGFAYATEKTVHFGRFGTVTLYYESPRPSHVILFMSGDGGWNLGVVDMAKALAANDALVAGVNVVHYLRELESSGDKCSYPAGDFEELSKYVQRQLDYSDYVTPVLVGYSSGATLVYAALAQAPSNTFKGAISLGFCPDLPLTKPMCPGSGLRWKPGPKGKGYIFLPAETLEVPWIALQGTIDQVCDAAATEAYVKQVPHGEVVVLPKVGHGFAVQRRWMPQFKEAFFRILEHKTVDAPRAPLAEPVKDLPLVEVPTSAPGELMAVHISGDGGWGVTDRGLSAALAAHGIPVVGLNSLHYFWTRRTAAESASDLERILRYYLAAWRREKAILIGYSLGADVLPFIVNRMSPQMQSKVALVALLGPSAEVDFEFHLTDWLGDFSLSSQSQVEPEIEKLKVRPILCFSGEEDDEAICRDLPPGLARLIVLKGGHRVGGDFEPIAEAILKASGVAPKPESVDDRQ